MSTEDLSPASDDHLGRCDSRDPCLRCDEIYEEFCHIPAHSASACRQAIVRAVVDSTGGRLTHEIPWIDMAGMVRSEPDMAPDLWEAVVEFPAGALESVADAMGREALLESVGEGGWVPSPQKIDYLLDHARPNLEEIYWIFVGACGAGGRYEPAARLVESLGSELDRAAAEAGAGAEELEELLRGCEDRFVRELAQRGCRAARKVLAESY